MHSFEKSGIKMQKKKIFPPEKCIWEKILLISSENGFGFFSDSPFASNELALQNLDGLVNFIQWGKNFLPMHF